jgi:radical SAM superfamily enzyme YgiQ (UPF0313 family)
MILLLTPPFTQLNTPYPATTFIKGKLKRYGIESKQIDLSIKIFLKIFSQEGLIEIFDRVDIDSLNDDQLLFFYRKEEYIDTIDSVVAFLQGKDNNLSYQIIGREYLPEGNRFKQLEALEDGSTPLEISDGAKYLASLYIDDIMDFISSAVAPGFHLSKYKESIVLNQVSFKNIYKEFIESSDPIREYIEAYLESLDLDGIKVVALTIPFPGNLFGAMAIGNWFKKNRPDIKVVMGGGFCNTELRSLSDNTIFQFTDYITLDDGEKPLKDIYQLALGNEVELTRTYCLEGGEIIYHEGEKESVIEDYLIEYDGIDMGDYLSITESTNPMFKLWSEKGWSKLIAAHGCYWKKCAFCDTSIDYICRYKSLDPDLIISQIEHIITTTGSKNFHFVDEALPPATIKRVALKIIERGLKITWWGNIRFEPSFTKDLCELLAKSGCIAVTGGFEVVTDRLLELMEKGVTTDDVARVCNRFSSAGILVHTYLIYAFPTQTQQELIDAVEILRQFYQHGLIQSSFWHRFSLTVHSPIYSNPDKFGVIVAKRKPNSFSNNEIKYREKRPYNLDRFSFGLKKSTYNFMNNTGFNLPAEKWFDFKAPQTTINKRYLDRALKKDKPKYKDRDLVIWIGAAMNVEDFGDPNYMIMKTYSNRHYFEYELPSLLIEWLLEVEDRSLNGDYISYGEFRKKFPNEVGSNFMEFTRSEIWNELKSIGLKIV